jgi:hypothetical protein
MMANVSDITDLGIVVRDKLQRKIEDVDYTPDDRNGFTAIHFVFSRRLSDFAAFPGNGQSSPSYDRARDAVRSADAALDACRPDDPSSVNRVNTAVNTASAELAKVTRAAVGSIAPSMSSALAIRRPANSPDTAGSQIPRAGASISPTGSGLQPRGPGNGPTGPDPTEPYLTSLAKLFPAESLSALLLVLAIEQRFVELRYALIGLIIAASIAIRYFTTRNPDTGKADILAIAVSVVSFLIYSTAMMAFGVLFNTNEATTRIVATVVAVLWMGILAAVVRKTPAP